MTKFLTLSLLLLIIVGCSGGNTNNEGTFITESGTYYNLLFLGDSDKKLSSDGWVELNLKLSWKDSVLFSSMDKRERGKFFLKIDEELKPGGLKDLLVELREGDSARALIPQKNFFEDFLYIKKPDYISSNQLIVAELKVFKFLTNKEYSKLINTDPEAERKEIEEYRLLSNYLNENNIDPHVNFNNGIYLIKSKTTEGKKIEQNDVVSIKYECYLLNGKMIDSNIETEGVTIVMGKPDQVIDGMVIGLYNMKEGEKARLVIPSNLAFGEEGSIGNIVPSYTSLVVDIQVDKVNKND